MHFMDPAADGGSGKACQLQFGLSQSILQLQLILNLQHIFTPSRFVSIVCLDMYTLMLTVWWMGWQHREAATHPIPPDQPRTGQSSVKRLIDKLGQHTLAWWLGGQKQITSFTILQKKINKNHIPYHVYQRLVSLLHLLEPLLRSCQCII